MAITMGIRKATTNPDSYGKQGHMGDEDLQTSRCGLTQRPTQRPRGVLSRGVTRREAPTNVRTAPPPKLMKTGPLSPAQGLSINQSRH